MRTIKNIVLLFIAVTVIITARMLSIPIVKENEYSLTYSDDEVIEVGNFNSSQAVNNIENSDSVMETMVSGIAPFAMYLLSLLCLLQLIRETYIKFKKERDLTYKTFLILILILQLGLIGVISFYVADMSFKILIGWLAAALILVRIVYEGNYLVDIIKCSRYR